MNFKPLPSFWRFAGLTFAISWLCWIPIALTRHNALNTEFIFLLILGACGPSLAGLYLTYREGGKPVLKVFARRAFELRFSARWWIAILLIWPVLFGLAAFLASRFGGYPYPYSPLWTVLNAQPVMILPQVLVFLFWGPLSEEYGWRGYAQERIQGSLGKLRTALLIGGVWALWQLPLFFITGTAESNLRPALFLLNVVGLGVIYAALYDTSGRKLGAVIALHFFYNLTLAAAMLIGRFLMIVPIMALAGSLVKKKISPPSAGTFPVSGTTFTVLLLGTVLLIGALNFLPALALGPIVEHFLMIKGQLF